MLHSSAPTAVQWRPAAQAANEPEQRGRGCIEPDSVEGRRSEAQGRLVSSFMSTRIGQRPEAHKPHDPSSVAFLIATSSTETASGDMHQPRSRGGALSWRQPSQVERLLGHHDNVSAERRHRCSFLQQPTAVIRACKLRDRVPSICRRF
jgi:hypothetical protein